MIIYSLIDILTDFVLKKHHNYARSSTSVLETIRIALVFVIRLCGICFFLHLRAIADMPRQPGPICHSVSAVYKEGMILWSEIIAIKSVLSLMGPYLVLLDFVIVSKLSDLDFRYAHKIPMLNVLIFLPILFCFDVESGAVKVGTEKCFTADI